MKIKVSPLRWLVAAAVLAAAGPVTAAGPAGGTGAKVRRSPPRDGAQPPAPPAALRGFGEARMIYVEWNPSTDNRGIVRYEVFVNGGRPSTIETGPDPDKPWAAIRGLDDDTCYDVTVAAVDANRNRSAPSRPARFCTLPGSPTIKITSPAPGAALATNVVTVTGTVGGGASAVLVNGVRARLEKGTFTADEVSVRAGDGRPLGAPFAITAIAGGARNEIASDTVTVYASDNGPPLLFEGSPAEGAAPLLVTFTTGPGAATAVTYSWDLDGDGAFEEEGAIPADKQELYETPGVYQARARVTDAAGSTYTAAFTVRVAGTAGSAADLPDRAWAEMIGWLQAGDIDRAMEYFDEGQKYFYRDLLRRSTDLRAFATQAAAITMKSCNEEKTTANTSSP